MRYTHIHTDDTYIHMRYTHIHTDDTYIHISHTHTYTVKMESENRPTTVLSYLLLCTANTLDNLSHCTFKVLWHAFLRTNVQQAHL